MRISVYQFMVRATVVFTFCYCVTITWRNPNQAEIQHAILDDTLLNATDIKEMYQATRQIKSRPVLVTLVNDAYIPFLHSWLCNTKHMELHKQVLIITTCNNVTEKLKRTWPLLTVIQSSMNFVCGDQDFSHVGYLKLMIRRTEILLALLEIHIEILLFEVDSLWLKNPIPFLQNFSGYDIIAGRITGTSEITGGFLYLKWSVKTIKIMKHLNDKLLILERKIRGKTNNQIMPQQENDQIYLSKLILENNYGLKKHILNVSNFADGMWYCLPKKIRRKLHPYLINNNWVVGNNNKINRAKMWRHWFINDQNECNFTQVQNVVFDWNINYFEPADPFLFSPCAHTKEQFMWFAT